MPDPSQAPDQTPSAAPSASSAPAVTNVAITLPDGLVPPVSSAALFADIRALFSPANAGFRDAALNALGSKKWIAMLIVLVGCFGLVLAHQAVWSDVRGTVHAVAAMYFGAQGLVDVAKHAAIAKVAGPGK